MDRIKRILIIAGTKNDFTGRLQLADFFRQSKTAHTTHINIQKGYIHRIFLRIGQSGGAGGKAAQQAGAGYQAPNDQSNPTGSDDDPINA